MAVTGNSSFSKFKNQIIVFFLVEHYAIITDISCFYCAMFYKK